jgi:hypothetical protein
MSSRRDYSRQLIIHPKAPNIPWIFDLPPDTTIASHPPHDHIEEHLHDHFFHMHIRYGFEFPAQTLSGIDETAFEVVMMIKADHRVDCNPIFVAQLAVRDEIS